METLLTEYFLQSHQTMSYFVTSPTTSALKLGPIYLGHLHTGDLVLWGACVSPLLYHELLKSDCFIKG